MVVRKFIKLLSNLITLYRRYNFKFHQTNRPQKFVP